MNALAVAQSYSAAWNRHDPAFLVETFVAL